MYEDDEEELELLRQYEDKELNEDEEGYSSDDLDSDLEDKIMSMVQYGSGLTKKKAVPVVSEVPVTVSSPVVSKIEPVTKPKVVYAPSDKKEKQKTSFSAASELQLQNSEGSSDEIEEGLIDSSDDGEEEENNENSGDEDYSSAQEDLDVPDETPEQDTVMAEPKVTRYINLEDDEKKYMEDEDTSEEEAELGLKLQELIEDQIYNRQSKKRFKISQPIRVCYSCHQPGHERKDCKLCMDCGGLKHPDSRCVGARYCARCKLRGHSAADCYNNRFNKSCALCNRDYHHQDVCPSLLHKYVNEVPLRVVPQAWCYQCTSKGHYGDDCLQLPQYLETLPSAFSKDSLSYGSRFDPKKSISHHRPSNNHQRWSDSSRENSPRRNYDSDRDYNMNKRTKYEDNSQKKFKNDNNGRNKKNNNGNSNKSLDTFFQHGKGNNSNRGASSPYNPSKSGNSNWKAMNNNTLPQPTRTGTVNVNTSNRRPQQHQQQQQRQPYGTDFPRTNLPRPTASGVIDLSGNDNNSRAWAEPRRAPKYHGGYNRRR